MSHGFPVLIAVLTHRTFRLLTRMNVYTTAGPVLQINWTSLIELN
jgi:hypothetical protein